MANFYTDIMIIDNLRVLTLGVYISNEIKQPISSHILTDSNFEDKTFPEDARISRRLIQTSIANGILR